jgi:hypothetical protein
VKRAIKAIAATGQPVAGVRFHDEGFTVLIGGEPGNEPGNPWDQVFNEASNVKDQKRAS